MISTTTTPLHHFNFGTLSRHTTDLSFFFFYSLFFFLFISELAGLVWFDDFASAPQRIKKKNRRENIWGLRRTDLALLFFFSFYTPSLLQAHKQQELAFQSLDGLDITSGEK